MLILTLPTVNGPTATHNSPHTTNASPHTTNASTESTTSTTYRNFPRRTTTIPIIDPPSTGIKGSFQSKQTSKVCGECLEDGQYSEIYN